MGAKDTDTPTHVPAITRAARPRPLLLPPAGTEDIVIQNGRIICARILRSKGDRPFAVSDALQLGSSLHHAHASAAHFLVRPSSADLQTSRHLTAMEIVVPKANVPAHINKSKPLPQHPDIVVYIHLNNISVASANFR